MNIIKQNVTLCVVMCRQAFQDTSRFSGASAMDGAHFTVLHVSRTPRQILYRTEQGSLPTAWILLPPLVVEITRK